MYKLGSKLSSKSHWVKGEDIFPLPRRNQRKAALDAREKIKELVPQLRRLVSYLGPTHSWDYNLLLQILECEDEEEDTPIDQLDSEPHDAETEETYGEMEERQNPPLGTSSGSLDNGNKTYGRNVNAVDPHRQERLPVAMGTLNRPQVAAEVRLDSVQNLGAVLGEIDMNAWRGAPDVVAEREQQSRVRAGRFPRVRTRSEHRKELQDGERRK